MLNQIVIPLSSAISGQYGASNPDVIEGGLLKLEILPNSYRILSGRVNYERIEGVSNDALIVENLVFSFQITTYKSNADLGLIFYELLKETIANPRQVEGAEIWDYHTLDSSEDRNRGYAIRHCLFNYEYQGGSFTNQVGKRQTPGGYRLIFESIAR